MNRWSCAGLLMPICLIGQFPATSHAQNYPAKPPAARFRIGDRPEEFAAFIKADIEKWRKIVLQRGLSAK